MFAILMLDMAGNVRSYCYHDPDCGYVMTRFYRPEYDIAGAKLFPTRQAAEDVFNSMRKEKVNTYSDGSTTPPMHIWEGLQICNTNPKDEGMFAIVEVNWTVVHSVHVQGELTSR